LSRRCARSHDSLRGWLARRWEDPAFPASFSVVQHTSATGRTRSWRCASSAPRWTSRHWSWSVSAAGQGCRDDPLETIGKRCACCETFCPRS
jgi:hypothetical protein